MIALIIKSKFPSKRNLRNTVLGSSKKLVFLYNHWNFLLFFAKNLKKALIVIEHTKMQNIKNYDPEFIIKFLLANPNNPNPTD
jgi:hypothetical protein